VGRQDLRCPLGCRAAHRRQSSTQRSVAYYRTAEGQEKKKLQNGKRRPEKPADLVGKGERATCDAALVVYVAMVVSLIEGRRVGEEEIRELWARAVRQHRMARRRRIDYVLNYVKNDSS